MKYFTLLFLMLLGSCVASKRAVTGTVNLHQLLKMKETPWLSTGIQAYKPDEKLIDTLRRELPDHYRFIIFGGLWCSDTREFLPRFVKVMNNLNVNQDRITYYLLDERKKSKRGKEKTYQVNFVPTLIVLKGDKEIGRITEQVKESVEADLLEIARK